MIDKNRASGRTRQRKAVHAVLDGAGTGGMPGLVKTMYRMIGDDQPSFECIKAADDAFGSASSPEQVWDAALDMAACLRGAEFEVEPPDPPPPEDPHPDPPPRPPRGLKDNVADIVLAGLLVRLREEGHRR